MRYLPRTFFSTRACPLLQSTTNTCRSCCYLDTALVTISDLAVPRYTAATCWLVAATYINEWLKVPIIGSRYASACKRCHALNSTGNCLLRKLGDKQVACRERQPTHKPGPDTQSSDLKMLNNVCQLQYHCALIVLPLGLNWNWEMPHILLNIQIIYDAVLASHTVSEQHYSTCLDL